MIVEMTMNMADSNFLVALISLAFAAGASAQLGAEEGLEFGNRQADCRSGGEGGGRAKLTMVIAIPRRWRQPDLPGAAWTRHRSAASRWPNKSA